MREIIFRGKSVSTGSWAYGDLVKTEDGSVLVNFCKVHPETVGQYTGIMDKKHKMIFEGDECTFGIFTPKNKAVVNFEKARFILVWGSVVGAFGERARHSEHLMFAENIEVIGNVHDKEV